MKMKKGGRTLQYSAAALVFFITCVFYHQRVQFSLKYVHIKSVVQSAAHGEQNITQLPLSCEGTFGPFQCFILSESNWNMRNVQMVTSPDRKAKTITAPEAPCSRTRV